MFTSSNCHHHDRSQTLHPADRGYQDPAKAWRNHRKQFTGRYPSTIPTLASLELMSYSLQARERCRYPRARPHQTCYVGIWHIAWRGVQVHIRDSRRYVNAASSYMLSLSEQGLMTGIYGPEAIPISMGEHPTVRSQPPHCQFYSTSLRWTDMPAPSKHRGKAIEEYGRVWKTRVASCFVQGAESTYLNGDDFGGSPLPCVRSVSSYYLPSFSREFTRSAGRSNDRSRGPLEVGGDGSRRLDNIRTVSMHPSAPILLSSLLLSPAARSCWVAGFPAPITLIRCFHECVELPGRALRPETLWNVWSLPDPSANLVWAEYCVQKRLSAIQYAN